MGRPSYRHPETGRIHRLNEGEDLPEGATLLGEAPNGESTSDTETEPGAETSQPGEDSGVTDNQNGSENNINNGRGDTTGE